MELTNQGPWCRGPVLQSWISGQQMNLGNLMYTLGLKYYDGGSLLIESVFHRNIC